ncbi:adenine deaminase [Heyndrickxia acidicola]|uniref:Adenine deaminase n=1 Tax=Heyndrickxia acidicola TaxID=209389 RepID=A0ABU6MHH2_9BACI|nr:adenine deaminase [Heyndrickxia acidicola]MED1204130.1 adenine deaminase [Heyndrickxia acidicola]
MNITKNQLKTRIAAAGKKQAADLVFKNGKIIDVFNLEIIEADLAISDGYIVGIGEYEGREEVNLKGKYIAPGFIDAHVHIESSMVTPVEFAKVVLPHGVTTVITDPHEIANVAGEEGIAFMLENSKGLDLDVLFMLPSSVPATPFENAGAVLHAEHLELFYKNERVAGLAEVMDFPGVANMDDRMLDKLVQSLSKSAKVDGHGAGLDSTGVNIYRAAGIATDHECTTEEEARDRLMRGMYLMIREGSVAKNLSALIKAVKPANARRCLFCTDDKHLDDLIEEGSVDHHIRLAVQLGMDPLQAIQMTTLNAAECFGLADKGAIAPGYQADMVILESLEDAAISDVYKAGRIVVKKGCYLDSKRETAPANQKLTDSVRIPSIKKEELQIPLLASQKAHVIDIIPNQIMTKKKVEEVPTDGHFFVPSTKLDFVKLAVIERHKGTGNIGLAIVHGLGMTDGAIATTVAHDSHNLIAAGTNDEDMLIAIKTLQEINGGMVIVKNGRVIHSLSLPLGGLMSHLDYQTVNQELQLLNIALQKVSSHQDFNLFLTLSFLSLPVIPELKVTDLGLFDAVRFCHIPIAVDSQSSAQNEDLDSSNVAAG